MTAKRHEFRVLRVSGRIAGLSLETRSRSLKVAGAISPAPKEHDVREQTDYYSDDTDRREQDPESCR